MRCTEPGAQARRAILAALALATSLLAGAPLATSSAPIAASTPDPSALLRASIDAPRTVSYVGQLETLRFSSSRANATIVRIEHRAPDRTRRWYLAPESLYGDYIVTAGTSTYQFDTKRSKLTVSHQSQIENPITTADGLSLAMENYRPFEAGHASIAGRGAISIVLVNRFTGERAMRVWIDDVTHLVLKKEEYHNNGAVASQTRFEELRYTSAIPDDVFRTSTPAGYSEVERPEIAMPNSDLARVFKETGFPVESPKSLPQGFRLFSGDVASVPTEDSQGHVISVRSLHLVYSDGLRSLSLFENAAAAAADFGNLHPKSIRFENHDAEYVEDGPTTLLTWKEHGLYFALVGDLQRDELIEIAKSVIPG